MARAKKRRNAAGKFFSALLIAIVVFGVIYAAVYHKTAIRLDGSPYTGRVVGISVAGIELVIWPVVSLISDAAATFATVSAAALLALLYIRAPAAPPRLAAGVPDGPPEIKIRIQKTILALSISVVLITVMVTMMEDIFLTHIARGEFAMQDWPRLIHAVGVLSLGFLADMGKRRYLAITTFCVMLLFSAGIILWESSYPFAIAMCVHYVFRAAGIMFFTVSFLDISPKSGSAGFWSPAGRMVNAMTEALLLFTLTVLRLDLLGMILVSLLATMLLFLTMLWGRLFLPPVPISLPSDIPRTFDELIAGYGVTKREAAALRLLLDDKNTAEIAEAMYVTEGTVYKYFSSMIAKTGVKNRMELIARFNRRNP